MQASGVLGEAKMRRLFDYLRTKSLAGESPKEITIAMEVFDRPADFDVSQDALVRVYIHKLRKTLEDFYAAQPETLHRLSIPRGEYRLIASPRVATHPTATLAAQSQSPESAQSAESAQSVPASPASPSAHAGPAPPASPAAHAGPASPAITAPSPGAIPDRQNTAGRMFTLLCCGAVAGLLLAYVGMRLTEKPSDLDRVRANPLWSAILSDDRPILVVVGDYYLIGETDESMEVKRLIREYSVNSKGDLDFYLKLHPEAAERYVDVGLRYLPTSAAFALGDIMPVLANGKRRVSVRMVSDLNADALKTADIIYIGYLSGLGVLQPVVFSGSRFAIGESYDELRDTKTQHTYISQTASQALGAAQSAGGGPAYRDYGWLANIRGPGGNAIVIIAGTRDEGVRQTADAVTNPDKLAEIGSLGNPAMPFEALIEVSALDGVNLSGKVLLDARR